MSLWAFLSSAVGGTLLGGATQLLGTAVAEAREWSASKRRIAELAALKEKQIALGELEAFARAQEGTMPSNYQPPAEGPIALHWIFAIVEAITRLIRPAMAIGACIYIWTRPASVLAELEKEIITVSFACIYFWLGVRHQRASAPAKK